MNTPDPDLIDRNILAALHEPVIPGFFPEPPTRIPSPYYETGTGYHQPGNPPVYRKPAIPPAEHRLHDDHDLHWLDEPGTLFLRRKLHVADSSTFVLNLARVLSSTCLADAMQRVKIVTDLIKAANAVQYPVFALDKERHVIAWNPPMENLTGIAARDIIGKGEGSHSVPFYGTARPMLADNLLAYSGPVPGIRHHVVPGNLVIFTSDPETAMIQGKAQVIRGRGSRISDDSGAIIAAVQSVGILHAGPDNTGSGPVPVTLRPGPGPNIPARIPANPAGVSCTENKKFPLARDPCPEQPAAVETGPNPGVAADFIHRKRESLNTALHTLVATEDRIFENFGKLSDMPRPLVKTSSGYLPSREFLSRVITDAREGIIAYNRDLECILWNPFMEHLTGIAGNDVLGKHAFEMFPALQNAGASCFLDQALSGKTVESSDISIHIPSSGKQAWVRLIFSTLYDNTGRVMGIIVIVQDMTAIKVMEYALQSTIVQLMESEEKYRSIFNAKNVPLILVDTKSSQIIDLNDASLELYGYTREEMSAIPLQKIFADPGRIHPIMDAATPGTSLCYQRKNDGSKFPADVSFASFTLKEHKVLILSVRDLSSVYLITDALRLANTKLNLLIGITRHDVINNLTALMGYNDLMKNSISDPSHLAMLEKQDTALQIIHHQIEFTREYYDLGVKSPLWQNICDTAARAYSQFTTIIPFSCETQTLEIYADPLLEKVFYNLFDNAFRYGESVSRIVLYYTRDGDDLLVIFADDGEGILPEHKQRIFARGFGRNSGLGLFLSKEILSITRIEICENGEFEKGARFELRVPQGSYRFSCLANPIGNIPPEQADFSAEDLN